MLHTDSDFLSAIASQPADRTLRLVYADWLDEQSDPRGALVRIEEEMRELPVFADRFWELKPRRNALRTQIGAEWCEKMRYGTECAPVFRHGIPDGWRERWRLIREFTERWHRVPMPDVGGRQKEIAEAESRLGRELPPSVREWIAFAHDVKYLTALDPELNLPFAHPFTLEPLTGQPALSLLYNAYDEIHRAVRFTELHAPDPPVEYYRQEFDATDQPGACVPSPDPYFPIPSVTGWIFDCVLNHLPAECARSHVVISDPTRLYPELDRQLSPRIQVGNCTIIEVENILIRFSVSVDRTRYGLELIMSRHLSFEEVPEILADMLPIPF
jgi:uncharacterized protein (TIGR02996 family)